MTDKFLLIILGVLLLLLGVLLLTLKLRAKKEMDTFGKAAKGQMIVVSIGLILGGLILILKNV
jgi:hypothetical protein